jgi:hypothetical protein
MMKKQNNMKFKNLWTRMAEIDEIKLCVKITGLIIFDLEADWSTKWFSITVLNFNWHTK